MQLAANNLSITSLNHLEELPTLEERTIELLRGERGEVLCIGPC